MFNVSGAGYAWGTHPRALAVIDEGRCLDPHFRILVLKRLPDAQKDGDRIYATIRSVGASSDGRNKSKGFGPILNDLLAA